MTMQVKMLRRTVLKKKPSLKKLKLRLLRRTDRPNTKMRMLMRSNLSLRMARQPLERSKSRRRTTLRSRPRLQRTMRRSSKRIKPMKV